MRLGGFCRVIFVYYGLCPFGEEGALGLMMRVGVHTLIGSRLE